jgi:hypothetical protein
MVILIKRAHPDDVVTEATADDLHQAWLNALRVAGCSYEELADQARTGAFRSPAAHRAWPILRSLLAYRQPPA